MKQNITVNHIDKDRRIIEVQFSREYMNDLCRLLNVTEIEPNVLEDFLQNKLEVSDRIDYGYVDLTVLPTRVPYILTTTIGRNEPRTRGIRNSDFVLFMELLIAGRLGHVRNLGIITKNLLISFYNISYRQNVTYRELIDAAVEYIFETYTSPNLVTVDIIKGVIDDFKDAYNLL